MLFIGTKEDLEEAKKEYGGKRGIVFKEIKTDSSGKKIEVALRKGLNVISKFLTSKGK